MKAELEIVEKRIEMEKSHQIDQAKSPKLKITAFNGTARDLVRFENMFITQVHNKNCNRRSEIWLSTRYDMPKSAR